MASRKTKVFIGTSGWNYKHWRGTFYPNGLKQLKELEHIAGRLPTVEVNNSFYRMPSAETFREWRERTPRAFLFAVKASRYITHLKRLKDGREPVRNFLDRAAALGNKLGPILFQLPPRWPVNIERLEQFLEILPRSRRYAFEFRDPSWYRDDVYALLRKRRCAFCIYELAGHRSPEVVTSNFVYVRLHGPGANKYQGKYTTQQLRKWANKIQAWRHDGKDVYVYFDNDEKGYAGFNAEKLAGMAK